MKSLRQLITIDVGLLFVLVLALPLSGCLSVAGKLMGATEGDAAFLRGEYDVVIADYESRWKVTEIGDHGLGSGFPRLMQYCRAAYYGKYYDRLPACFGEFERHIRLNKDKVFVELQFREEYASLRALYALDLADYNEAIKWATELISFDPRLWAQGSQQVTGLGVIAIAHALTNNPSAARQYAQRLEAFRFDTHGDDAQLKPIWLARSYFALGDYQRAYTVIHGSSGAFARAVVNVTMYTMGLGGELKGGSFHERESIIRQFLSHKSELETGRLTEAKTGFDALLTQPSARANGDILWLLLYDRGRISEKESDLSSAARFYAEAVDAIERQRSTLNSETSKIGFVGSKQNVYRDLIRVLMSQGQISSAFEYVERAKARALVDMLAGKRDFAVANADPERVRELLSAEDAAETNARAMDTSGTFEQKRTLVVKTRQALATQAPELSSLVSVSASQTSEVQQALANDETLVEYYYSGENLYVFVVTRDAVTAVRTSALQLDDDVQAFRKSLQSGDSRWKTDSGRLFERLIRPVKERFRSTNLTIVAHGSLHYLPFNALHDGSRFLVETYSIRLLPAATVLKFLQSPVGQKPGTLLAFGNPDLKDSRYDLAFAQAEAQNIVRIFPTSRALMRGQATKTAFQRYATDFRMLHVASHGEFDPAKPLTSSLLLAPDMGSDGRLSVSDLYSMRIDADLVTLSACETGLGRIANGDDVVGLTRGFLYAGTRSVVASLWQVDDRATGELMTAFYKSLAKGTGKREALRAAQVGFLKTEPNPFFWAAFQLTGSP